MFYQVIAKYRSTKYFKFYIRNKSNRQQLLSSFLLLSFANHYFIKKLLLKYENIAIEANAFVTKASRLNRFRDRRSLNFDDFALLLNLNNITSSLKSPITITRDTFVTFAQKIIYDKLIELIMTSNVNLLV